jgi:hypothetical protein
MKTLQKAEELIEKGAEIPKRVLYLAYIQLHVENPTYHPDDCLRNDGYSPYKGWEVVLVNEVSKQAIREDIHYPSAFLKLPCVLDEIIEAEELESEMACNAVIVKEYLTDMDTGAVHTAYDALLSLYLYMADEDVSDDDLPAGVLKACVDVLDFIGKLRN